MLLPNNYTPQPPSYTGAIYQTAVDCAFLRKVKKCKEPEFGGIMCNECKCNPCQYVDADPRQIALMMLQAERDAFTIYSIGTAHNVPFGIVLVFCLLMAGRAWLKEHKSPSVVATNSRAVTATASTQTSDTSRVYQMIDKTLYKVARDMNNKVDVNKDGKTNCVDAAVTFYKYFPDKSIVCIEGSDDLRHLFNCVKVDGVWRAVEPQAYLPPSWGYDQWWMRTVWGSRYDASQNIDETEKYKRYAK
jgi:hypothetical protein